MTEFKPKAVFTLFSLSTCGHCKHFKGDVYDDRGNFVRTDPKGSWTVLRTDPDLYNAGVEFVLYQVGTVKDPATGQVKQFKLEPQYSHIKGFPHFELSAPGDRFNGIPFQEPVRGWNADQCVSVMKNWILKKIAEDARFKQAVQAPRAASAPGGVFRSPPPPVQAAVPGQEVPQVLPSQPPPPRQPGQQPSVKIPARPSRAEMGPGPEAQSRIASTFGLGTQPVRINNQIPSGPVPKSKTRFLPSNYDN